MKQRWVPWLVTCGALCASVQVAQAARYHVKDLGPAAPAYVEHRISLNEAGQVVWAELTPQGPAARLSDADTTVDLHALLPEGVTRSYAQDISDAGLVVGYAAADARENYRRAVLWAPAILDDGGDDDPGDDEGEDTGEGEGPGEGEGEGPGEGEGEGEGAGEGAGAGEGDGEGDGDGEGEGDEPAPAWTVLDLHAAYAAFDLSVDPPDATAAYAISAPFGEHGGWIAGYVRQRATGPARTWSQPVVWELDPSGQSVSVVRALSLEHGELVFDYGIAYGVAEDGTVAGGVGLSSGASTYMVAAWWDGLTGELHLVPELDAEDGYVTSVANRVRLLDVDGQSVTVIVGQAYNTLAGPVDGFVFVVGDAGTDLSFVLDGGSTSAAMDVTVRGVGVDDSHDGLVIVGMSNGDDGIFTAQPNTSHATVGARRGGLGPDPQVCDVNDALPAAAGSLQYAMAVNRSGVVAGWGAGRALLVTPRAAEGDLSVFVRDTPARPGQPAEVYFWAQRTSAPSVIGHVIWSNSSGCTEALGCADGALELSSAGESGLDHLVLPFEQVLSGQFAVTERVDGLVPSGLYSFVQASSQTALDCGVTDVAVADQVEIVNPAGVDPWGDLWCDLTEHPGAETNVHRALDACGTDCGALASAVDGLWCTSDLCTNGVITNPIASNACLISGDCHTSGAAQPIVDTGAEPATTANFCQVCEPAATRTSWTNPGDTCCTGNQPTRDVWEIDYRPAAPANVAYAGTSLSAVWLARLADIAASSMWASEEAVVPLECDDTVWACDTNPVTGARQLTSALNGLADQEDWFWFRHLDVDGAGPLASAPRVRLAAPADVDLDLCVYWRCLNNPGDLEELFPVTSPGAVSTPVAVSRLDSPLHDGVDGLVGVCATTAGAGAADLVIDVEAIGCGGMDPWDVDVFVQVRPSNDLPTCSDTYSLYWGNEQGEACGGGLASTTCLDCCDADAAPQAAPL